MKRALWLFFVKAWDNVSQVVIFNLIWAFFFVGFFLSITFAAHVVPIEFHGSRIAITAPVSIPLAAAAAVLVIASWVFLAAVTGLAYYAMADIVVEYDWNGYKAVFTKYFSRGPLLRSVALVSLYAFTFAAALTSVAFYLGMGGSFRLLFMALAGIMIWFCFFSTMAFFQAMALMAQTGRGLWSSVLDGVILVLIAPARTFVITAIGVAVLVPVVLALFGAIFFAIAIPVILFFSATLPAVLFNADVRLRLEDMGEGKGGPNKPADKTA